MDSTETEACGRCATSAVVDVATDGEGNRDPLGDERIEVEEERLRSVSPGAWLGRVERRLDAVATRLSYGR